jgi:hypothetical protein
MQSPTKFRRPEDAELWRKRDELADLQARLAELELQLLTLRLELTEFEGLYHGKVGPLYAELDEVEALIAERLARVQPLDSEAAESAINARKRADASRRTAEASLTPQVPITRSRSLKDLYRAVAKRLHPDLSRDESDRATRERLMTEANLAYAQGDEARLRAILEEYDSSPDTVVGSDVGAELIRTIRHISLTQTNLRKVEAEIGRLKASEIHQLKTTVEEGRQGSRDVLGELVESLRDKIRARRQRLQSL